MKAVHNDTGAWKGNSPQYTHQKVLRQAGPAGVHDGNMLLQERFHGISGCDNCTHHCCLAMKLAYGDGGYSHEIVCIHASRVASA